MSNPPCRPSVCRRISEQTLGKRGLDGANSTMLFRPTVCGQRLASDGYDGDDGDEVVTHLQVAWDPPGFLPDEWIEGDALPPVRRLSLRSLPRGPLAAFLCVRRPAGAAGEPWFASAFETGSSPALHGSDARDEAA